MLAEIYLVRLQTLLRNGTSSSSASTINPRFVPIVLAKA